MQPYVPGVGVQAFALEHPLAPIEVVSEAFPLQVVVGGMEQQAGNVLALGAAVPPVPADVLQQAVRLARVLEEFRRMDSRRYVS